MCTCTLWPAGIPERTQSTCFPLCSLALFAKAYYEDQGSPWTPTVLGVVGQEEITGRRWAQLLSPLQGLGCPIAGTV